MFFKKSKTPVPSGSAPPFPKEVSPAELSQTSSLQDKDSEKSVFGRVKDNTVKAALPKAGYTKQRQESLQSDRSEIKSLDELFSKGTDAEDPTSSSSLKSKISKILSQ